MTDRHARFAAADSGVRVQVNSPSPIGARKDRGRRRAREGWSLRASLAGYFRLVGHVTGGARVPKRAQDRSCRVGGNNPAGCALATPGSFSHGGHRRIEKAITRGNEKNCDCGDAYSAP